MLDEKRLTEIREWARVARPGPWFVVDAEVVPGIKGKGIIANNGDPVASVYSPWRDIEDAHAGIIAAAPDLLAEVDRLRAENDALRLERGP